MSIGRKILVFQHVAWEPLGTLTPLLKNKGLRVRYINFQRTPNIIIPDLDRYSGLIILGGPMNADQIKEHPHLKVEMEAIEQALAKKKVVFGICLGSQLLAKVLGSPISKGIHREIGWTPVNTTVEGKKNKLFENWKSEKHIFQWHSDSFRLPSDCVHLASSKKCEIQAFSYKDHAYGFQFHLEVDSKMIHRWLKVPENLADLTSHGESEEKIMDETGKFLPESTILSESVFGHVASLFALPSKTIRFSSAH